MHKIRWYLHGFSKPKKAIWVLFGSMISKLIKDDKTYLAIKWWCLMPYKLHWDNPQTFCEKLQWLKLYNRKPEYTTMVDKHSVKKYVADIIGEEYIIPTLGVWDNADDIDFDSLPDKFVLKCNHNSGTGMYICKDKSQIDIDIIKTDLSKGLKEDYYSYEREWPYKNVPRKIIAEQFMVDHQIGELRDYKFFCFNGVPKYCQVIRDRSTKETIDFYDLDWNHQAFVGLNPKCKNGETPVEKPDCLQDMVSICQKLSMGIPFVRVDLYNIGGHIYFGELTFYPNGGMGNFSPNGWDYTLGGWIKLSNQQHENTMFH